MFTSKPHVLVDTVNIFVNRAFEVNSENFAGFTVKLFRENLELALRSSFFLFEHIIVPLTLDTEANVQHVHTGAC